MMKIIQILKFPSLGGVRGGSLIKIISLTLGLVVALVLFSKVAFEMGYDSFHPDVDRIFRIQRIIYSNDKVNYETETVYAPVAPDLKTDIPEIEEAAVAINGIRQEYFHTEDTWIKERILNADASFFDLFGMRMIVGDKQLLGVESNLFLSESAARRFFGEKNAVGEKLLRDTIPYTVAGIFKDVPAGHLEFDVMLPFINNNLKRWRNPEAFLGYIKLREGVAPEEVEARIKALLPKYMDVEAMAEKGDVHQYFLNPVSDIHIKNTKVRRMIFILSLLAFLLLFVAAMNYVLISISSLAKRAKTVGIHKCNGASDSNIFHMFINETGVLTGVSLLVSVLLIFVFRAPIEEIIQTPLSSVFSTHNLWVTAVVVLGLLLLAGVVPALIFSAVPVTYLFRAYSTDKKHWKRVLLFVQFTGVAFMATLLFIIVKQYDLLMTNELGYTTESVVYSENIQNLPREQVLRIKQELERMPEVASAAISSNLPIDFMNGIGVENTDNKEISFSSRCMGVDNDFLNTLQIELLAGSSVGDNSYNYTRAVVNETFAKQMGWKDSPVGKTFIHDLGDRTPVQVLGVVKDFQSNTLYENKYTDPHSPMILFPLEMDPSNWLFGWNRVILRLHRLDGDLLTVLNDKMQQITNKPSTFFVDYDSKIKASYKETLLYRNSILAASIILLFITALGLFGFTDDEVNRRSKEIAIRKIIGATARDVLVTISKGIVVISIPAILMGLAVSYVVGSDWLQQFAIKIPLNIFLFAFSGTMVLAGIIVCIITRTWSVANQNPVESIKTE